MKPGDLAINQAAGRVGALGCGGCLVGGWWLDVRFRACYAVNMVGMRPLLLLFFGLAIFLLNICIAPTLWLGVMFSDFTRQILDPAKDG